MPEQDANQAVILLIYGTGIPAADPLHANGQDGLSDCLGLFKAFLDHFPDVCDFHQRRNIPGALQIDPAGLPDYEFGTWSQTLERWYREGLPEKYSDWRVMEEYFGTDDELRGSKLGLETGLFPKFKHQVLEEKGDHRIVISDDGAIYEEMKPEIGASIPICLRHAIESRADWETLRDERLNPATAGRYPANLDALCSMTWGSEDPVLLFCGSLFGSRAHGCICVIRQIWNPHGFEGILQQVGLDRRERGH